MDNSSDRCLSLKREEQSLDRFFPPKKRSKMCSSGSCVPKEDHLRYLSDDILSVIVSFLTMNDVGKLKSLVSCQCQWLDLWIHTPVLIFLPFPVKISCQYFVTWVNRTLERHKGRFLKEFKVFFYLDREWKEDIGNWLEFALSRKVERLELNFLKPGMKAIKKQENYYFPDRFLQSDLLKCLKSLSLKNMIIRNEAINYFVNNCPFLERLELVSIHFFFTKLVISGPNSALKHLQIRECYNFKLLSISNANLVSLEIPSLEDDGLTLTNLSNLVELSISGKKSVQIRPKKSLTLSRIGSWLLSQLQSLMIAEIFSEEIFAFHFLSRMTKLKRLVVEVLATDDESLTMLIPIINSCPRLEEFQLKLNFAGRKRTTRNIYSVEGGFSSLQSKSLKVFEFLGYYGRASDVELTLQVVESAVCLKKLIIDPRIQVLLEDPWYVECDIERETRNLAITQLEALRITQCIAPHVDVVIL